MRIALLWILRTCCLFTMTVKENGPMCLPSPNSL